MSIFSFSFAPEALKEIAAFAGFSVLLDPEMQIAMQQGGQLLIQGMQDAMDWKEPTGTLEDSFSVQATPYELQIGSNVAYARRRNYGFSGMTDALGRYYPYDPGAFYVEAGVAATEQQILQLFDTALEHVIAKIGGA